MPTPNWLKPVLDRDRREREKAARIRREGQRWTHKGGGHYVPRPREKICDH